MTERERQAIDLVSDELTVGEIAQQLGTSRSEAANAVKWVIERYGDPRLERIDAHIAALRKIDVKT